MKTEQKTQNREPKPYRIERLPSGEQEFEEFQSIYLEGNRKLLSNRSEFNDDILAEMERIFQTTGAGIRNIQELVSASDKGSPLRIYEDKIDLIG